MCLIKKQFVVLFAEDNDDTRITISRTLSAIFEKVYSAKDGVEALEVMKKHNVDILISDINMPKLDGIELIKKTREIHKLMPIIITTAHSEFEKIYENVYNIDTLTKPYSIFDIIKKIEEMESKNKIVKDSEVACKKIEDIFDEAKNILKMIGEHKND